MYLIAAQFSTTIGTLPITKQIVKKYVLTKNKPIYYSWQTQIN